LWSEGVLILALLIDGDPDEGNPSTANNSYWGQQLGDAVKNGSIPESRFDDMVH
jgi:beta-glucosidase